MEGLSIINHGPSSSNKIYYPWNVGLLLSCLPMADEVTKDVRHLDKEFYLERRYSYKESVYGGMETCMPWEEGGLDLSTRDFVSEAVFCG